MRLLCLIYNVRWGHLLFQTLVVLCIAHICHLHHQHQLASSMKNYKRDRIFLSNLTWTYFVAIFAYFCIKTQFFGVWLQWLQLGRTSLVLWLGLSEKQSSMVHWWCKYLVSETKTNTSYDSWFYLQMPEKMNEKWKLCNFALSEMESGWYLEEQGFPGSKHRKNAAKCYKRKTSMNSWISGLNGPPLEKIVCEKPLGGCFGKVKKQKDGDSDISRDGWSPCGGDPAGECSWTDQPTRQEKGIHRSHQLFRLVCSLFSQQALDTRKF